MIIVPGADEMTNSYWEGAKQGKLLLQRCRVCGHLWHPPGPMCLKCHSTDIEWTPARGGGTVHSYTIVHHATHAAMKHRVPYLVALVDLEEGPRVVSNILAPAETVRVGMPVALTFQEIATGVFLPQFTTL